MIWKEFFLFHSRVGENTNCTLTCNWCRVWQESSASTLWGASSSNLFDSFLFLHSCCLIFFLFDIFLPVMPDAGCSLQQGCACCVSRSLHKQHSLVCSAPQRYLHWKPSGELESACSSPTVLWGTCASLPVGETLCFLPRKQTKSH